MLENFLRQLSNQGETYLRVKARPGAAVTAIRGVLASEDGETVKIDLAAPAQKGKANQELVRFLATLFGVIKNQVTIISGAGEKIKLVKVTNNK